jgi:hypothetical protein
VIGTQSRKQQVLGSNPSVGSSDANSKPGHDGPGFVAPADWSLDAARGHPSCGGDEDVSDFGAEQPLESFVTELGPRVS